MKTSNLPLGSQFFSILEENQIVDWEAKHFWEKMQKNSHDNKNSTKVMLYRGLEILVINKYLEKRKSPNNKRVHLYTGTSRIEYFINYQYNKELHRHLDQKIYDLNQGINNYECRLNFINELTMENSILEKYVSKYTAELNNQINELQLKLDVINSIIDQHKISLA